MDKVMILACLAGIFLFYLGVIEHRIYQTHQQNNRILTHCASILDRLERKPHERDLKSWYEVTVLGETRLYTSSFLEAWDFYYGHMIMSEYTEDQASDYIRLYRITGECSVLLSWTDVPQNKESRERSIDRWIEERQLKQTLLNHYPT